MHASPLRIGNKTSIFPLSACTLSIIPEVLADTNRQEKDAMNKIK